MLGKQDQIAFPWTLCHLQSENILGSESPERAPLDFLPGQLPEAGGVGQPENQCACNAFWPGSDSSTAPNNQSCDPKKPPRASQRFKHVGSKMERGIYVCKIFMFIAWTINAQGPGGGKQGQLDWDTAQLVECLPLDPQHHMN